MVIESEGFGSDDDNKVWCTSSVINDKNNVIRIRLRVGLRVEREGAINVKLIGDWT